MAKADVVLLKSKKYSVLLASILMFFISASIVSAITPNGANITQVRTETANSSNAGSHQAQAGNVTELNIYGYSTTQSWQGYFGNISGAIQLTDANSKVMYNWSLANPAGEVYASTNSTINWGNIQCFNYTAKGNYSTSGETPGGVSLYGTNLTQLEARFWINSTDVDGVNETFNLLGGAGQHDEFYTANKRFAEGQCVSTRVFSSAGIGENNKFEEVLLYEPTTTSVIFASLIEPGSVAGFDGRDYDFEMLVLENGHDGDTGTTNYYFFVELE